MALPVEFDRRSGVDRRAVAEKKENNTSVFRALEVIPTVRRVSSLPEKWNNGDTTSALGLAGLALINLPEDLNDIKGAINQLKGAPSAYDHINYQHNFSFFRGTTIEKWLHRNIKDGKKWAQWLYENDSQMANTSFGKKVLNILKADVKDIIETPIADINGERALAYSYSGKAFAQLTARALRRTTKFGLCALALLEVPKIIKSDEKIKQTAKSGINVTSLVTGIGYGGAIGAKYGGACGSLVGMGVGAVLGSQLSKELQEAI